MDLAMQAKPASHLVAILQIPNKYKRGRSPNAVQLRIFFEIFDGVAFW
jgi:hypothetical protein